MKFTLEIELGNEAMQDWTDISHAIKTKVLANQSDDIIAGSGDVIRDTNGNTVGKWQVSA